MFPRLDDRAVSDTIGFVFVFALIVSSVAIVSVVGMSSLEDARNNEQVDNAERAFEVLSENIEDLRRDGVPSRATEIKLGGASIRTGESILVKVTANGSGTSTTTSNMSVTPIVYEAKSGEQIRYVNGAIIRSNGDGTWLVREPRTVISTNRTIIPVLRLVASDQRSMSGEQTVHVRTVRSTTDVAIADTGPTYDQVTVRMETPNSEVWTTYYEEQGMTCTSSGETLRCTRAGLDHVYVTVVRIPVGMS